MRTALAAAVCGALGAAGLTVAAAPGAQAAPAIGKPKLVVLLCTTPQLAQFWTPPNAQDLRNHLNTKVDAWIRQTSRGHATVAGVPVYGWFTVQNTTAPPTFVPDCTAAAVAAGVAIPAGTKVLVASYTAFGCGLAPCPENPFVIEANFTVYSWANGIARTLGLRRVGSEDVVTGVSGRFYGDDWTINGFAGFLDGHSPYVPDGSRPGERGLGGYELDRLSWLDESAVVTAGADGRTYSRYSLAPLDQKPGLTFSGVQLIRVPYRSGDPQSYFTVEFRAPGGDPTAPGARVLIHRVSPSNNGGPRLLRDARLPIQKDAAGTPLYPGPTPVSSIELDGVTITTLGRLGNEMIVDVTTPVVGSTASGPNRCATGYVWRAIDGYDHVCVTPQRKLDIAWESIFGSVCLPYSVYRRAFPTDNVCVSYTARANAAADNADAANHLADPNA